MDLQAVSCNHLIWGLNTSFLLFPTQSICLIRVYDLFFPNCKLFHIEYKSLILVCIMTDKGSFNMKIRCKAFQTRKWWRRKKKWVAKYSKWMLEKKIITLYQNLPKSPSCPHWVFEWGCSGQGNNDARPAYTVNCPFQVALPSLHEGSHLLRYLS